MKRLFTSIFFMFVVIGTLITTQAAQHTIHATAQGGSISPHGNVSVPNGASQTFFWTPFDDCWVFERLEIDGEPAVPQTPGQFTFPNVQRDHTINVIFTQITYVIEASSGPNGAISPHGDVTVTCDNNQTFTFTPDDGYEVDSVWVDGNLWYPTTTPPGPLPPSYQFSNVKADGHTIVVTFKAEEPPPPPQFIITPSVDGNGTISPNTPQAVNQGANFTFTITADLEHHIASIIVDDGTNPAYPPLTWTEAEQELIHPFEFTDVQDNHTIYVTFEPNVSIRYDEIPELGVYPNPTTGRLSIVSGEVVISKIEITNTLGNVVMVIDDPADNLDLSALAKGTYLLRFTTTKGSAIRQIIRN